MTHKKQRLAILGSTGSIGTQTLDIVRRYGDLFEVTTLTARSRWEALVAQAIEFSPDNVVIADETYYPAVRDALADRPVKVLNLFGYTGGATLACLAAGASVTHVDASKGMVAWARENAQASSLADRPCRWIVDDCAKFVQREIRRGSRYDAVIMDPPSYGRGPNGEIWKLEDNVYDLITLTEQVLSDKPLFFAINSYTEGLSPAVMEYVLKTTLCPKVGGHTSCDEIGLPVTATGGVVPCGATAVWEE